MARLLSLEDLAVYNQTLLAYQTFVPALGLGISHGLYYILPRNEHRQRAVAQESWILLFCTGMLYALFMLFKGRMFLAQRVDNLNVADALLWMIPLAVLSTPASIQPTIFVYREKIQQNARLTILGNVFCALTIMGTVIITRAGMAAVCAHSVSYCMFYMLGLILAYRLLPDDDGSVSRDSIKAILKVSIPLGIASMLATLSNNLDKWIISFMRTPEEYAIFSYGAHELPFFSTIAGAISTVIIVDMVNCTKRRQYDEALKLFRSVAKATSYLVFPVMMLFMVIAEPFYEFLYTKTMLPAVSLFRLYLLLLPIRTTMYGPLMIAMGKSKQVLYGTIVGMATNLVLSILLVWRMGTIGATVATVVTLYLVNIPYNLIVIGRETKMPWYKLLPFKHFGKCIVMSSIPAVICHLVLCYLGNMTVIIQIVLMFLFYLMLLIPLFYVLFRDDCKLYLGKLKRLQKRDL